MIKLVFPAYAGVILTWKLKKQDVAGLSRVCGGDPIGDDISDEFLQSFPRMRG